MGIGNKTKLEQLISYCYKVIEEDEEFSAENCPNLDECQEELNHMEVICMNYLFTKSKDDSGNYEYTRS